MPLLETVSDFVMSLSSPLAEYLSEKLADRFGRSSSRTRQL